MTQGVAPTLKQLTGICYLTWGGEDSLVGEIVGMKEGYRAYN